MWDTSSIYYLIQSHVCAHTLWQGYKKPNAYIGAQGEGLRDSMWLHVL